MNLKDIIREEINKVVSESCYEEVISAYHGSPTYKVIGKFKKGKRGYLGPAIYFTNSENYARGYADQYGMHNGRIYKVEIKLNNPLRVSTVNPTKEFLDIVYGSESIYRNRSKKQTFDTYIINNNDIKRFLSKGYDGVIWTYGGNVEYVIYDSNDIKILEHYES